MMSLLALMLTVFSVGQGDALRIAYAHEAGLEHVEMQWRSRTVPFVQARGEWITIIGADLDMGVGDHPVTVIFGFDDGRRERRGEVIRVEPISFPITYLTVEPRFVELSPEDLERSRRESRRLSEIFGRISTEILWDGPFLVPIPNAEGSNFGHRRVFNEQPRNPHSGADISAVTGTAIRSSNRGRVVETGDYFFNGNTVIVDHGIGIYSVYLHLSRIDVEVGQLIDTGEVLGLVGATGRVTGPHLHWGFRVQNARVDPFSLTRIAN
jgi:murein DD-endopeptidase MepM/ murein hydrolase activator NlpD